MSAGFTPGPWEAHLGILADAPSVWDVTAKVGWSGNCDVTPEGWFVATVHEVQDAASAEANARLIAAAPELLEALEALCATLNGNGYATDHAARAIAKAKGEPA